MKKLIIIFVNIILFLVAILILFYHTDKLKKKVEESDLQECFNGIVKNISYDEKKFPTVTINNHNYYINRSPEVRKIIKLNDSIVKQTHTLDYLLYRKDKNGSWQLIYGQESNDGPQ